MVRRFAQAVSIIFEPFTVSFIALILITSQLDLPTNEKVTWFFVATALGGLPPALVLFYEKRIGKIKDWFITNRLERRDVHLAWFFGSVAFVVLAIFLHAPRLLVALSVDLMLLSLAIGAISPFWKISVHMVGVTLLFLILLLVYSSAYLWLGLLLPLVAWARVNLGHHTLTQVTIGTILTIGITYVVFSLFSLATF